MGASGQYVKTADRTDKHNVSLSDKTVPLYVMYVRNCVVICYDYGKLSQSVSAVHVILPYPVCTANYNLLHSLLRANCADCSHQAHSLGLIQLCCVISSS